MTVPQPGAAETRRRLPFRVARILLPVLAGLVAATLLFVVVGIPQLTAALARFRLTALPLVILLLLGAYGAQGWRWHLLLRDSGLRLSFGDSQLLNLAGQLASAVLPIGDLARALFASQAARGSFGVAAATVTVQELGFTLLMVLVSTPGIVALGAGIGPALLLVAGVVVVILILTVQPVFRLLDALVGSVPATRPLRGQLQDLQRCTVALLSRPRTLAGLLLDLLRAAITVTAFWLIAQQLEPGHLSWTLAAFVLTFAFAGGALSTIPGGIGVTEAGMVALLAWAGMSPGSAAAAAILQRTFGNGIALFAGVLAYSAARRRHQLGSLVGLKRRLAEARKRSLGEARDASAP